MQVSETLSADAWKTTCDDAQIISTHAVFGPKVIRLKSGEYIKVFNAKAGFTKRHFFPKYKTFVKNADALKQRGFRTITVSAIYALPHIDAFAVRYYPLEGDDFRHVFKANPEEGIQALLNFVIALHNQGVYFHGMHLGNVLYDKAGQFGVIDMADLSFHRAPLRMDLRVRQLRRLFRYVHDKPYFNKIGIATILSRYTALAQLSGFQKRFFNILWAMVNATMS